MVKSGPGPEDVSRDSHQTGLIFAGAPWDLRKALIREAGEQAAVDLVNRM